MKLLTIQIVAATVIILSGCGGGQTYSESERFSVALMEGVSTPDMLEASSPAVDKVISFSLQNDGSDEKTITSKSLFAWAERNFPDLFPRGPQTQTYGEYEFRYYPASDLYLALANQRIFLLGQKQTGGQVVDVGGANDYIASEAVARGFDCIPQKSNAVSLIEIRSGFYDTQGEYAGFDPCHASVSISLPPAGAGDFVGKPPLFILAHGGSGVGIAEKALANELNSRGIATLYFDAYEMNGFYQGRTFWQASVTNRGRQLLNYTVALRAYEWAKSYPEIDTSRIFLWGISNGGNVVANLAGVVDPAHVKGVFAEGAPIAGLGFPHQINVPTKMVYGKLDNYGGLTEDDWMVDRQAECYLQVSYELAPSGTSDSCNYLDPSVRFNMTESPREWVERLKANGQDIELVFYENAGHGIVGFDEITKGSVTYGTGATAVTTYSTIGSAEGVADQFIADLVQYVRSTY
jgi:dienelactone hydrolase